MTTTKHTPAPWTARQLLVPLYNGPSILYRDQDGRECALAQVAKWDGGSAAEAEANARLIAAAPELLAALHAMLGDYRSEGCADPNCLVCRDSKAAVATARAAIAKAEG